MNQDYIKADNWSIIEEGFDAESVKSSESLFSIGNGAIGQRTNFEESYTDAALGIRPLESLTDEELDAL